MCRALPYTKSVDWRLDFKLSPNIHFDKRIKPVTSMFNYVSLVSLKITLSTNFTCQVQIISEALKTTKVNILTITSWSANSGMYLKYTHVLLQASFEKFDFKLYINFAHWGKVSCISKPRHVITLQFD